MDEMATDGIEAITTDGVLVIPTEGMDDIATLGMLMIATLATVNATDTVGIVTVKSGMEDIATEGNEATLIVGKLLISSFLL